MQRLHTHTQSAAGERLDYKACSLLSPRAAPLQAALGCICFALTAVVVLDLKLLWSLRNQWHSWLVVGCAVLLGLGICGMAAASHCAMRRRLDSRTVGVSGLT